MNQQRILDMTQNGRDLIRTVRDIEKAKDKNGELWYIGFIQHNNEQIKVCAMSELKVGVYRWNQADRLLWIPYEHSRLKSDIID